MQAANFCSKHGGGWAFPWRNRGSVQTKRPAERAEVERQLRAQGRLRAANEAELEKLRIARRLKAERHEQRDFR